MNAANVPFVYLFDRAGHEAESRYVDCSFQVFIMSFDLHDRVDCWFSLISSKDAKVLLTR